MTLSSSTSPVQDAKTPCSTFQSRSRRFLDSGTGGQWDQIAWTWGVRLGRPWRTVKRAWRLLQEMVLQGHREKWLINCKLGEVQKWNHLRTILWAQFDVAEAIQIIAFTNLQDSQEIIVPPALTRTDTCCSSGIGKHRTKQRVSTPKALVTVKQRLMDHPIGIVKSPGSWSYGRAKPRYTYQETMPANCMCVTCVSGKVSLPQACVTLVRRG